MGTIGPLVAKHLHVSIITVRMYGAVVALAFSLQHHYGLNAASVSR